MPDPPLDPAPSVASNPDSPPSPATINTWASYVLDGTLMYYEYVIC